MTMLAGSVDVAIGVDTHKHTHTAAVIDATTGAALAELTVDTDLDGYAQLVALADERSGLRHCARSWDEGQTGVHDEGRGPGGIGVANIEPGRPR